MTLRPSYLATLIGPLLSFTSACAEGDLLSDGGGGAIGGVGGASTEAPSAGGTGGDGGIDPQSSAGGGALDGSGGSGLITTISCAPIDHTGVLGGPTLQYGFCWYLGQPGETCDQTCGRLDTTNSGLEAASAYQDSCMLAGQDDISHWFFENGNPGGWVKAGGETSGRGLGYGYATDQSFYGKCVVGETRLGTFPGEPLGVEGLDADRELVCACAGIEPATP
ncbi:MAG: hypothetical protein U0271_34370 [Polyangiaceae bacterium]